MSTDYRRWVCATCKHWDRRAPDDASRRRCYRIRPVTGDAGKAAAIVPTKPTQQAVVMLSDTHIETGPDFGCRLWDRR